MTANMTAALKMIREALDSANTAAASAMQAVSVAGESVIIVVAENMNEIPQAAWDAMGAAADLVGIDTDQVRICTFLPNCAIDK